MPHFSRKWSGKKRQKIETIVDFEQMELDFLYLFLPGLLTTHFMLLVGWILGERVPSLWAESPFYTYAIFWQRFKFL